MSYIDKLNVLIDDWIPNSSPITESLADQPLVASDRIIRIVRAMQGVDPDQSMLVNESSVFGALKGLSLIVNIDFSYIKPNKIVSGEEKEIARLTEIVSQ